MPDPDLIRTLVAPVGASAQAALIARSVPPDLAAGAAGLLEVAELGALALVAARGAGALLEAAERAAGDRRARAAVGALFAASALVAGALLVRIVRAPSAQMPELFARWDHLAFAFLAGCALSRASAPVRAWTLTALSVGLLLQYAGAIAVLVVGGAGLLGFAALLPASGRRPWVAVPVQATVLAAAYAYCWHVRGTNILDALRIEGLAFFLFLRHISFVADVCRGSPASLAAYLCYVSFYPIAVGGLGSPEVYQDFARRNLRDSLQFDHRLAVRKVVVGALQIWAASRLPISFEHVLASSTAPALWASSVVLFVQVALQAMGYWALIEATALLYGFRLQPNFKGVLTRQNPSELWWAWRGSLTNWLVRYVYGPLGANRRHQSLNILAAFGVSMVWHWMAVPFLSGRVTWRNFVPITAWFVLNAACVVGHVLFQRRGYRLLPEATPAPIRRGVKIALTILLGTSIATLPQFQGPLVDRFPHFLRVLVGLPG